MSCIAQALKHVCRSRSAAHLIKLFLFAVFPSEIVLKTRSRHKATSLLGSLTCGFLNDSQRSANHFVPTLRYTQLYATPKFLNDWFSSKIDCAINIAHCGNYPSQSIPPCFHKLSSGLSITTSFSFATWRYLVVVLILKCPNSS